MLQDIYAPGRGELAVGALPEHEPREADLAGADDDKRRGANEDILNVDRLTGGRQMREQIARPERLVGAQTEDVQSGEEGYLSTLDAAMAEFRRLRQRFASFEEFRADVDTRELCVHYLRIALESVLDVCRHFLGAVGVGLSDLEAANLIELAGEKGLLERTFASRIRGVRNAIVHVDWRLDYHAIHRAVTEQVSDFDEFARRVRAYLEQDGRKQS